MARVLDQGQGLLADQYHHGPKIVNTFCIEPLQFLHSPLAVCLLGYFSEDLNIAKRTSYRYNLCILCNLCIEHFRTKLESSNFSCMPTGIVLQIMHPFSGVIHHFSRFWEKFK